MNKPPSLLGVHVRCKNMCLIEVLPRTKPPSLLEVHVRCENMYLIEVQPRPDEAKREITVHPKQEGKWRGEIWSDFECPK